MYAGEVNVAQDQLPQFLKTAERLKVSKEHLIVKLIRNNQSTPHSNIKTAHHVQYPQVKGLAEAPQNVKDE